LTAKRFATNVWLSVLLALGVWALLTPAAASARGGLKVGFADGLLSGSDSGQRDLWLGRAAEVNADLVRINVPWRSVATSKPGAPTNPADAAYEFGSIDAAVRDASARGFEVLFTVYSAPGFAEGSKRPGAKKAPLGTWKPKPGALGDFAQALATRYSGSFAGLPRVAYMQAWNEANLNVYLTPQYKGKKQVSGGHYRKMLNAFTKGVSAAGKGTKVVTTGAAPYGDPPGGPRTRPLAFWREAFCLKSRKKLKQSCNGTARFDVFAHHPISTTGGPRQSAFHPDDVTIPDMGALAKTLRAAERSGGAAGSKHQIWVTELWWETNPPDRKQGVSESKQARWLNDAYYLLWKKGVSAVINLQIRDLKFDPSNPFVRSATGIYFYSGKKKKSYDAVRFPFVARSKGPGASIWGVAPSSGKVVIESKTKKGWKKVGSIKATKGGVFSGRLSRGGKGKMRARAAGQTSFPSKA
jgi:hypothetical protein